MIDDMIGGGEHSVQTIPSVNPTPVKVAPSQHMMMGVDFQSYLPSNLMTSGDQSMNHPPSTVSTSVLENAIPTYPHQNYLIQTSAATGNNYSQ